MIYPFQLPWTGIGSLQSEVDSIRSEIRGKANSYEITEIVRRLDSVECSMWEISSSLDSLLYRMQTVEENQITTEKAKEEK